MEQSITLSERAKDILNMAKDQRLKIGNDMDIVYGIPEGNINFNNFEDFDGECWIILGK